MIFYRLVYHPKHLRPIISRVISTFKFGYPRLTLKKSQKVKSDHTRRFRTHDFLYVGLPYQTSRTNNKRVISTFKFGYRRLTMKKESKVKSDHTRRFPAHDFLYVCLPSQTSRITRGSLAKQSDCFCMAKTKRPKRKMVLAAYNRSCLDTLSI